MEEKRYCLCFPNKCEDKYLCCGKCSKLNKCKFDRCLDNPTKCKFLATEEEVEFYTPKNHMAFDKYKPKKDKKTEKDNV